jgi:putative phosphoesterase
MTTRMLLLSDTHVPQRARDLSDDVWRLIDEADLVMHAGDWNAPPIHDRIAARAARLVGVAGNNDGAALHGLLPLVARVDVEGVRVAVVHEADSRHRRDARIDSDFPDADLLVFGHSHIPWDTVSPGGMRLLNPGSATDRRRQPQCTVITAVADDGVVRDVQLTPVPRA